MKRNEVYHLLTPPPSGFFWDEDPQDEEGAYLAIEPGVHLRYLGLAYRFGGDIRSQQWEVMEGVHSGKRVLGNVKPRDIASYSGLDLMHPTGAPPPAGPASTPAEEGPS